MRGRKPIPVELRAAGQPAALPSDPPSCPDWLDPAAKAMWSRLAPDLAARGLLSSSTLEPFAGYCQCWAQWQFAIETVRRDGLILQSRGGMTRVNPAATFATEMAKQVRAYAAEFGLTPASRARTGAPAAEGGDEDVIEDFLGAANVAHDAQHPL